MNELERDRDEMLTIYAKKKSGASDAFVILYRRIAGCFTTGEKIPETCQRRISINSRYSSKLSDLTVGTSGFVC